MENHEASYPLTSSISLSLCLPNQPRMCSGNQSNTVISNLLRNIRSQWLTAEQGGFATDPTIPMAASISRFVAFFSRRQPLPFLSPASPFPLPFLPPSSRYPLQHLACSIGDYMPDFLAILLLLPSFPLIFLCMTAGKTSNARSDTPCN